MSQRAADTRQEDKQQTQQDERRDGPEPAYGPDGDQVAELCRRTEELAGRLPGQLHRIRLSTGELSVEAEWAALPAPGTVAAPPGPAQTTVGTALAATAPAAAEAPVEAGTAIEVTSPMVGTFYRAPEPGAAPFTDIGDVIEEGQTVAIVEAMKLMNPLAAEVSGRVVEICVKDGDPVEFGQPLMILEPAD